MARETEHLGDLCGSVGHAIVICSRCQQQVYECSHRGVVKRTTYIADCRACQLAARPKPRAVLLHTKDRRHLAVRRIWRRRATDR